MTDGSTNDQLAVPPHIRPAAEVRGSTLAFRTATPEDAEFVFALRRSPEKSRHLSPVSDRVEDQRRWLERYARSEGQAYFMIEHEGRRIGTVRLYDARSDSFCWGSWILIDDRPRQAAVESALMVYAYAVDHLGFARAHFGVRLGNEKVLRFHARMGARELRRDARDAFFEMTPEAIRSARESLDRFLPGGEVEVVLAQRRSRGDGGGEPSASG
ncbi:MAG: GNAT family N-acetyltransferase [Pseudomonadota bacterium]